MFTIQPNNVGNEIKSIKDELELEQYFTTTLTYIVQDAVYASLNIEDGEEDDSVVLDWINNTITTLYRLLYKYGEVEFNVTRAAICRHDSSDDESYVRIIKQEY